MDHEDIGDIWRHLPTLRQLQGSECLKQRDIRDRLNQSKSTTHRKVNQLIDAGLVQKGDTGYELTNFGRVVTEKLSRCADEIQELEDCREFLDIVEISDLRYEYLYGSKVTRASEENPFLPGLRLSEAIEGVENCRVLTNSIAPQGFAVGRSRVRDGEMNLEIVLDSTIVESLSIPKWYGKGFKQDLESGNLRLWIHEEVPYRIGVLDDKFVAGSDDEDGIPDAFLETRNEVAVEWAHSEIERFKEDAERVKVGYF